ncbi:hypothetical protein DFH09DRAFT_1305619 [Mycena vulgaris]|nr:hypothetical protein DFH09DRAFT_1305619 [Mycena vulgaris]
MHFYSTRPLKESLVGSDESLVDSVQREQFAAAERLRLTLVSEFTPIEPNAVYERAALAQLRWHGKQDLDAFLVWLRLVPDNKNSSRVENGPLTKTRNLLFRTGNPARNLPLIKEFSLVCAAKGYSQLVWDDLVRLMWKFEHAEEAVAFFLSFEAALLQYYSRYHPGLVDETASRQRHLLIMLCCDAGWLKEAVQLIRDSTTHRIKNACDRVIKILRAQNNLAGAALLEKWRARKPHEPDTPTGPELPSKLSTAQRIHNLFSRPTESQATLPSSPNQFYSTRAVVEGSKTLRSRAWIASQLREVRRTLSRRSLVHYRPPGNTLHSFMAHYDACKGYPHGLFTLRKQALSASDPSSYTWLCKEMFYLHESRKYTDIVALFVANFRTEFLPPKSWHAICAITRPSDPLRTTITVPTKLDISPADAWVIWNALVRLSLYVPAPLPVLASLHHSVVHYASTLTDRQFRAFPTSYTTVFRSVISAYDEVGEMARAVAAAHDMALIGKAHKTHAGIFDELAGVYARAGDVPAATHLLNSLEELGPRIATYGVMMDAYLSVGLVDAASELEPRMKEKCQYVPGVNWRMDTTLKALHAAQDALDSDLVCFLFWPLFIQI